MSSEKHHTNTFSPDLLQIISDILKGIKRLFIVLILLIILCTGFFVILTQRSYSPLFVSSATFTVYVSDPVQAGISNYNAKTAEQMSKTFPYVISSGALLDLVKEDLGLSYMPCSITTDVSANLFTINVTGSNAQTTYAVLNSVIKNYPQIGEFVVGPTTLTLLDESGVPESPVNPINYKSSVKKGVLTGIILDIAVLLIYAFTRTTIRSKAQIEGLTSVRCLESIPNVRRGKKNRGKPILISDSSLTSSYLESIRTLRIRVNRVMHEQQAQVLLVSSAVPNEGKSTVAVNLAAAEAQHGKRVLLIDCDLRNPSAHKILSMENSKGLSEYLRGSLRMDRLIHATDIENMYIITGGKPASRSSELLSKEAMSALIDKLRGSYDIIILDTPPCAVLADAAEAAKIADAAILVIRQDYASRYAVLDCIQNLADMHLNLIGCVLNCTGTGPLSADRYVYGYGYGYGGYGYGGQYGQRDDS